MMDDRKESYHYADIEMEGSEDTGMVIPPREHKHIHESGLSPNEKVKRFIESFQIVTGEKAFMKQARELEEYVENEALYVPFTSYWPQYDNMNEMQRAWYFYWRNEVRYERYTRTDLSYIFLYVYELINGVGWKEPQDGYYLLMEVWRTYRGDFPKLDDYLGDWIADFVLVHRLGVPYSELAERVPHGIAGSKDLFELELMHRFQQDPVVLTFEMVSLLSDYQVMKSKFYTGEGRKDLETYMPKVLALVDRYMVKMHTQRIIELFHPGKVEQRERYLFRGALYDSSLHGKVVTIGVVPISTYEPLRALITQLVRITENALRKLRGFKGKLRIEQVDEGVSKVIERYLERELGVATTGKGKAATAAAVDVQARVEVSIDAEKLAQLQLDSNEVREMLTVNEGEADANAAEDSDGEVHPAQPEHQEYQEHLEQPLLAEPQARDGAIEQPMTMMMESDDRVDAMQSEDAVLSEGVAGQVGDISMLDEDWQQFAGMLQAVHIDCLKELASSDGMVSQATLYAIASMHGTMPELIIEQINDAFMETIGDLLIEEYGVTDEYRSILELWMG